MRHKIPQISAKDLGADYLGDGNYKVKYVAGLGVANKDCLSFYKGEDIDKLKGIQCGILIVNSFFKNKIENFASKCIIFEEHPMNLFVKVINANFSNMFTDELSSNQNNSNISKLAYVESEVKFGQNFTVYPYATVYNCTEVGNNCEIQSNTVVGGIGMTYVKLNGEDYTRMKQLGKVIIEDNVDIGCNTTVLRGILEATIIRRGAKIGNHVNVGHNSDIGENAYISAGVAIGGATTIGKNSWIAPGVSIRDHITIGENCTIGVGSVVVKDTEPNGIYYGNPAKLIKLK